MTASVCILTLSMLLTACSSCSKGPESAPSVIPVEASVLPVAEGGTCEATQAEPLVLASCVERARYEADVRALAVERAPGTAGWEAAKRTCADRFRELGYEVEERPFAEGVNVLGKKVGQTRAEEMVVVSAHYDHIAGCAGADDNASGVAGLLEVARVLAPRTFSRTLTLACWDREESGLFGSVSYAKGERAKEAKIAVAYVFETMGYSSDKPNSQTVPNGFDLVFADQVKDLKAHDNRGDFVAVIHDENADPHAATFASAATSLGLRTVPLRLSNGSKNSFLFADLQRSDHASFWRYNYPAIQLTDTANFRNDAYHCLNGIADTPDRLDFEFATKITRATVASAASALGAP